MNEPVIKWTGSKRSQAKDIVSYFPEEINTYYEPFVGGGAILKYLISNSNIKVKKYICSDINNDLIKVWKLIKNNPKLIIDSYKLLWAELNKDDNKARKRDFYNYIREEFNKGKNPVLFFFIMRTTTNGMPRYNKKGEFNSSFHITRNGIIPEKAEKIINEWSFLLKENDVKFICCPYTDIIPEKNDFCYFDPPYANTKGMYYGNIENDIFFDYLKKLNCNYIFSFDGKSGEKDNTYSVPLDVYTEHKYLLSGNSSFKRVTGNDKNAIVYESLYIKK